MVNNKNIKAITMEYSNEYADFISDAINTLDDEGKERFINNLIYLYYCTMREDSKDDFAERYGIEKRNKKIEKIVKEKLNNEEFLTMKNQIIFRFGRIKYLEYYQRFADILNNIYTYDDNTMFEDELYLAFLRRGCAISSSFIGAEKIELDYVRHMLDYDVNNYRKTYDIANRSHTMLFYGDVIDKRGIFGFKDSGLNSCANSVQKRIERLSIELPEKIYDMDDTIRKKYYFRLFDLATIYCFNKSRDNKCLSEDDLRIIRNCRVKFIGQSTERENLMQEIKDRILGYKV